MEEIICSGYGSGYGDGSGDDGVCLCANCHINFAHQNGIAFAQWIIGKRGQAWYDRLNALKNTIRKVL